MQFEWTVFFGDAADAEARVYVLATPIGESLDAAALEGLKITGRVEGPRCRYSHTLPARIPVRFRGVRASGARPELVGEAIVPDPNFWTPELPFLYRATVEVRRGDEVVAAYEQDFGIRPLGVRGQRIVYCGKTWVPRAVSRNSVEPASELDAWRDAATVMNVVEPDDDLCRAASEVGVILIAGVRPGTESESIATVRRLGRYPAVFIAVIGTQEPFGLDFRAAARNILLASFQRPTETPQKSGPSDVFIGSKSECHVRVGNIPSIWDLKYPIVATSLLAKSTTLEDARTYCDKLQADLAGKCDPAGYIV